MKVLLLQDVERLGKQGEIVDVRGGFARNFLLPRRIAVRPTSGSARELELARRRLKKIEQKLISEAELLRVELAKIPGISLELRANEEGRLYGSVTPSMVVDALREHRLKIDAGQVDLRDGIKEVGDYEITVHLHKEVKHPLKLKVIASAEVKAEAAEEETQTPKKRGGGTP